MMRLNNIKYKKIKEGYDMQPFVDGKYDEIGEVVSAMLYNEYNQIIAKGVKKSELIIFNPADYKANFPEDGIYVSKNLIKSNKSVAGKFISASLRGWNYALAHPEEAVNIVMANGAADKKHQLNMIKVIKQNITTGGKVSYKMKKQSFDFVKGQMKQGGLLGNTVMEYANFFIDVIQ